MVPSGIGTEGRIDAATQDAICDDALLQETETKKVNKKVTEVKVMDYLLGLEDAQWENYGSITLEVREAALGQQSEENAGATRDAADAKVME